MIGAVSLTVAVAGFAVSAGAATVTQFLLLIPSLILVLVVEHGLKIHHCPGVPGLWTNGTNWVKLRRSSTFVDHYPVLSSLLKDRCLLVRLFSGPNIQACGSYLENSSDNLKAKKKWRDMMGRKTWHLCSLQRWAEEKQLKCSQLFHHFSLLMHALITRREKKKKKANISQ